MAAEPVDLDLTVDLDLDELEGQIETWTLRVAGRVYEFPVNPPAHVLTGVYELYELWQRPDDEVPDEEAIGAVTTLQGYVDELARMCDPSVGHVPLTEGNLVRVVGRILDIPSDQIEKSLSAARKSLAAPPRKAVPKTRRAGGSRSGSRSGGRRSPA